MLVSVLLVSHNGARWLPSVLAGVAAQTFTPDHLVAVDTGSSDDSVAILRGERRWDVHRVQAASSYAEVVTEALTRIPRDPGHHAGLGEDEPDWVWLLHDDANPDPDALERLLIAAGDRPDAAILGPKLREWPSLRRLLEVGVTISGTGRRETGLERGEYDQGQHDERRTVLAVNTAGMLVRRDVLEQIGFDPALGFFGTDVDFGWRAARAGHRTMVVPDAVVFHAEAAHRGQRSAAPADHHHRRERASAVYTLLVNGSARALPLRAVRLALGSVLRALGFLLVRAPVEAYDELVAVGSVLLRPGRIARGRRDRKGTSACDVRPLLAPGWLPYRHGLDFVGDVGSAALDVAREGVGGRSVRSAHQLGRDELTESQERGLAALLLRNPRFWLIVGSIGLALVAARDLLSGGALQGGALVPAPDGVRHWWDLSLSAHHLLGTGTPAPAPAYLLPLAALATLALGHPGWVVSGLFLLAVPLAALSALRFLRRLVPGRAAPIWGAVAYGLLPVTTGAVGQGRLGTVAGAIVLPWVATSALGLASPDGDRRWRAVWRTSLGAALLVAFVPSAVLLVAALVVVGLVLGLVRDGRRWRRPAYWLGPLVLLVAIPVLLLPWAIGVLDVPGAWLVEAGRAGALPTLPSFLDLATGRGGGPGAAPVWVGGGIALAGLLAGLRGETRRRVLPAWLVAAVAAGLVGALTRVGVDLPGVSQTFRPWTGLLLVVVHGALVTAAVVAGDGLWARISRSSFSWRQPVAAVALLAAAVGVVGGAAWWVTEGPRGPLHRGPVTGQPAYMTELSRTTPADGVLVLRGDRGTGVTYEVFRAGPLRLGDDAVLALTPPTPALTRLVSRVLADPGDDDAEILASYGVAYVYAPAPVSAKVSSSLDAATAVSRASAPRGDAAWRLQTTATTSSVDQSAQPHHTLLLLGQLLAIVVCVVLAVPSRRTS